MLPGHGSGGAGVRRRASRGAGARWSGRPGSRRRRGRHRRGLAASAATVGRARVARGSSCATSRRSSIGVDVPPVTPTTRRRRRRAASVRSRDALDLDGRRPDDPAQPGQLLRVRARAAADDDHQVDLAGQLDGVLLAADRDRADGVDDLELVRSATTISAASFSNFQGGWVDWLDERHRFLRAGPPRPTPLPRRRRSRPGRSRAGRRPRGGSGVPRRTIV